MRILQPREATHDTPRLVDDLKGFDCDHTFGGTVRLNRFDVDGEGGIEGEGILHVHSHPRHAHVVDRGM